MTLEYTSLAQTTLQAYQDNGEPELIAHLSVFARSESDHEAWTNSGVCLLIDGSAVIQDHHQYTFRWTDQDGEKQVKTRPAALPQDSRRYNHYPKGPIYQWPSGESLCETALTIRSADLDLIIEEAALELGIEAPTLDEPEGRNVTEHALMQIVPAFAQALSQQVPAETEDAAIDFQQIDDHLTRLAQTAFYQMDPRDTLKLDRTLALAALEFQGEDQTLKALADHWSIEFPI